MAAREIPFADIAQQFTVTAVEKCEPGGWWRITVRLGSFDAYFAADSDGTLREVPGGWLQAYPKGSRVTGLAAAALAHPGVAAC